MSSAGLLALGLLLLPLAAAVEALPAAAQEKKKARNDPTTCPYCHGDPEIAKRAGIVGHGPFEFGSKGDSTSVDAFLVADVFWIESAHFEIGLALTSYRVPLEEKEKIRAELAELALVLPEVDPKTKVLDEWLRVHLFAQRCEKLWTRFLELVQKTEQDFPPANYKWVLGTPYFGEGPYLGQRGKFEVMLFTSEAEHTAFLLKEFGLSVKRSQRWNVMERESITLAIHQEQGSLKKDIALHGHVAFNLGHNLLDAYKHYSYDTPKWMLEGLGHFLEREISPKYNTFDASEGAGAEESTKTNWMSEVRSLVQSGDAPRLAELANLQSFAEFKLPEHFTAWSMTDFLIKEHAAGYACIQDKLHGRKTPDGYADSGNLRDVHRDAFQECLGMSYAAFDQAWREWVLDQTDRKD